MYIKRLYYIIDQLLGERGSNGPPWLTMFKGSILPISITLLLWPISLQN